MNTPTCLRQPVIITIFFFFSFSFKLHFLHLKSLSFLLGIIRASSYLICSKVILSHITKLLWLKTQLCAFYLWYTDFSYLRFRMRQVNIVGSSLPSQPSRKIQTLQAPPDISPANVTLRTASETSLWLRWVVRHPRMSNERMCLDRQHNVCYIRNVNFYEMKTFLSLLGDELLLCIFV